MTRYLYHKDQEHSSCGVGFITHKKSRQTHRLLQHAHQALCQIPHRGGMSAEGVGDGAGVNIDLSLDFFRKLTGNPNLSLGRFGVGNFFYPQDIIEHGRAKSIIQSVFKDLELSIDLWRDVPVNNDALNPASQIAQFDIKQVVFSCPDDISDQDEFESLIYRAQLAIEKLAYTDERLYGLCPLSMSSKIQVLKGRLNNWEVMPYFFDLTDKDHKIHTLFFHTRFSTNTVPNPMFSQPFQHTAHNGELNTDRKNRLSEDAIALGKQQTIITPEGQSDSARLDQTLARRVSEDNIAIDLAALIMMPPAWENDSTLSMPVRNMLAYYSLVEEKNDGPAALIFGDGTKVGARLDRLGLRPLRTVETNDYLAVMSEAGQLNFAADEVIHRGRIEAGGMIVFDHANQTVSHTTAIMEKWASQKDYAVLLHAARLRLTEQPAIELATIKDDHPLTIVQRHVAYGLNQESFKFMLDPMLQTGMEKIFSMGYGLAPNALTNEEGGMSRYFSQRFAQVTNPPLDSIREADGMTLRVALGAKPNMSSTPGSKNSKQLVIQSPVLKPNTLEQIIEQPAIRVKTLDILYQPDFNDKTRNADNLFDAIELLSDSIGQCAQRGYGIIILSDKNINTEWAAIPAIMMISAANQHLIRKGLRFSTSLICATGQAVSTHDIACLLGFGASAVCPLSVFYRAQEHYQHSADIEKALDLFQQAVEKALMKTMGKFGLCTVESYIGGEFFEANFIDTHAPILCDIFPNISSPIGGAQFADIAQNATQWHQMSCDIKDDSQIPLLGLFKERNEGAGHNFGRTAVREYTNMTEEPIYYVDGLSGQDASTALLRVPLTPQDNGYRDLGYEKRSPDAIDAFQMTAAYRQFVAKLDEERYRRPSALRDVLSLPLKLHHCHSVKDFIERFRRVSLSGSPRFAVQGLRYRALTNNRFRLMLESATAKRHRALYGALNTLFPNAIICLEATDINLIIELKDEALQWIDKLVCILPPIPLAQVQGAHEITRCFASGAMSYGALVEKSHEAVAQGINIVGGMSNCGEGGEHSRRFNSIKASKIKQFASGRFGVWVAYLADPCLEEIEIKIAQGAKPGEGGQLPGAKVKVRIAAARGGTPGIELVSPPPHHDTYSIEDLAQLIHDAKAARVRVVVKLVSSEGIGTIAVGVAKAGADVINVAGNSGGTGAAQVTSLKHTGRQASIGIAEVHQALSENGLRDKVVLRCSDAHQTGKDVITSAILGGDSFEFGTSTLMMLKCVQAKNCHLKCPMGLTTNPELYKGDPRALAQYFLNLAHEIRELLASLGQSSLKAIRGKTQLLFLLDHPAVVGQLDMSGMLRQVKALSIAKPIYLEAHFNLDKAWYDSIKQRLLKHRETSIDLALKALSNTDKTVGGQLSIDIERWLNYEIDEAEAQSCLAIYQLASGRRILCDNTIIINSEKSAGQSYGAFNNSGITLKHRGTCNDGVGKSASGGRIVITSPGGGQGSADNVLIGNFALFGATGGELFVAGQAGDRFGVRNSGSIAVVEGVGDFCCEYMTNGTVINLGSFGKGFGNGMSGGTAYQYDPEGLIAKRCNQNSVRATALSTENALIRTLAACLLMHLEHYHEATGSVLATRILSDWQSHKAHFYVLLPNALFAQHRIDSILDKAQPKAMLEELAHAYAAKHIAQIKSAYRHAEHQRYLFDGRLPQYGNHDMALLNRYINASGVMHRALTIAAKSNEVKMGETIDAVTRYLFDSEDRRLTDVLIKDNKVVLSHYNEQALAALLAKKRLQDYKDALTQREMWDNRIWSTYAWIIDCDRDIRQALQAHPVFDEQLASHYCQVLAAAMQHAA